ncbi:MULTISPECIES: FtsB family cell division protein [unclassified Nocardioides]|uniref:FtsB family cell division protein n=1 Tax=Nocardioides sp. URHA0032 TaxID=1380388 RepID=UPI0004911162|nr:septum formation initiator family protein [Nocardioides sp. URHA0032]
MPSESRRTPSRGPRGRSVPRRPAPRVAAGPAAAVEARRPRFTGRAAILVLVVAVLTVSYASSLRAYLQQREHISDLKDQIALRQASIEDLEREKARWEDPAYVRQQARELNYVMPGETSYVVLDENGDPIERSSELTDPSTVARKPPTAWWSTAWQSVELAGNPPRPEPPPPSKIDEK